MHGLVTLFLEVIALMNILLLLRCFVLVVLVFVMRVAVALIFLMMIVRSLVVVVALVASMVVMILATMLPIAQITAAHDRKMSHLLLIQLVLLLDLLKDAGRFIGSLALLKKANKPKRVHGRILLCLRKLELMCLGLHEEDLFGLLLRCGQLHHLTDVATVKVYKEQYSTLHELMH
jgi:hypothetical protein